MLLFFVIFVISLTLYQSKDIIKRLQNNDPTLQVLGLKDNNIRYRGTECLANTLAMNSTLQKLSLHLIGNNIGNRGAECVPNTLASNSTLTRYIWTLTMLAIEVQNASQMHLKRTWHFEGAKCLANALAKNSTLQQLGLIGNNIRDRTVLGRITSYLEQNKNAIRLERNKNPVRPPDEHTKQHDFLTGSPKYTVGMMPPMRDVICWKHSYQ